MNFNYLTDMYIPIVMTVCLTVGYILKHWIKDVDNKIIPAIMVFLGAITACAASNSITLDLIASGMVTGLASTGMHQLFKQIIENGGEY